MKIDVAYESRPARRSERTEAVQDLFGIGDAPGVIRVANALELDVKPGQVLLITGPSGSGKSSILREIGKSLGGRAVTAGAPAGTELPVIDCVGGDLEAALEVLGVCGLGEAFLYLRRPGELSDGQRYRLGLALALVRGAQFVVADEFCSVLDRVTAKVIACNVRKLASRGGPGFVLASAHEDIAADLQPDVHVRKGFGDTVAVRYMTPERKPISFSDELRVEPGTGADWKALSEFHYKSKRLGAVDKIFRMRLGDETMGVVVYAYPAAQNSIRNKAFSKRYCGRLTGRECRKLLNKELRVVQRIVIDPRLRGLGLASRLLRETMGQLSVPYVECIAVMAGYSRFLENAGFVCLGRTGLPKAGCELLGALRGLGLDNSTIHDAAALCVSLRRLMPVNPGISQLLSTWWGTRRPGSPSGHIPLEALCREAARHVTSRPFYYLYDNTKSQVSKAPGLSRRDIIKSGCATPGKDFHHPRHE